MGSSWLAVLPASETAALAKLRLWSGVSVLTDAERIWISGDRLDDDQSRVLLSLPTLDRFTVGADGSLLRPGERTPSGTRPAGNWIRIRDCIDVNLPVAAVATGRVPRVAVEIVPDSESPQSGSLLMTGGEHWSAWGATAPQTRLNRLSFAACDDGRILVRGTPLPPVRGEQFVEQDRIAIPAGWTWKPRICAKSIRRSAGVKDDSLLLLNRDGSFEVVTSDDFVPARRSAIRATSERLPK